MKGIGVITFIAGAVVGTAVSYFALKKKFQAEADAQISEVRAKMADLQKDNDILRDVRRKAIESYNKPFDQLMNPVEPEKTEESVAAPAIDYAAISKKSKPEKSTVKDDITEITQHEYYNYVSNKNFSEMTFTYYQVDKTLVNDETGMAVHNPEKYVGANGVDAMSKLTVEETYFVDEANQVVNCITISEDQYYEDEAGYDL